MLTEHEALANVLARVTPLPSRLVPLADALHAFAARPLYATVPLPGFDNSAMDGYAVRASDTQTKDPLPVSGAVRAGVSDDLTLEPGCAIRIFTGAPMPRGADAVIMQEDVTTLDGGTRITCNEPVEHHENVRLTGCDLCTGQRILNTGDRLTPARLAVLASQGLAEVEVAAAPRIAIVTTGDELVPPGQPLPPGCIFNSNATLLDCLVRELYPGDDATRIGIFCMHLPDDLAETTNALRDLIAEVDFVILAGGVSVGEHDFVKPALQSLRIDAEFWRVKIKPGKPFLFAKTESAERPCHIFGLPGNPVSVYVTFQIFGRPALLKALGASEGELSLPQVIASLTSPLRNRGDRPHYIRGRHENGAFTPLGTQQSHALFGLSQSNALLRMDPAQDLDAGARVTVLLC
jgi:molybdopterin molybdotransferase